MLAHPRLLLWTCASLVLLSCCWFGLAAAGTTHIDARLRFWFDDYAFGEGETTLFKEAISQLPNSSVTAGTTQGRFLVLKGFQLTSKWDVYWAARAGCHAAFKRKLQPHQLVNCLPGSESITEKARLFSTVRAAYGERAALSIAPLTLTLPRDYFQLARVHSEGAVPSWVLKEEVHQGKGVHIVPADELLGQALQLKKGKPKFSLAQQLISNQLLVQGRPFYVRLWVLVCGSDPVRAYLYSGGVVVFGAEQQAEEVPSIVNLWTQDRAAADPWSLQQLLQHLTVQHGRPASDEVWQQMQLAVAATVAAAVPHMRMASANLPGYRAPSSGFAVYGADFVLDATLKPWVIEVNALPSLARKVITEGDGSPGRNQGVHTFDQQKQQFVWSTLQVLLARHAVYLQHSASSSSQAEGAACVPHEPGAINEEDMLALKAAQSEEAAAAASDFVVLTPMLYQALDCLAATGNATCAVLQRLNLGMPGRALAHCSASRAPQGLGWVAAARQWLGCLVQHLPQFNWGFAEAKAGGSTAVFQLSTLDRHICQVMMGAQQ